MKISSNYYKQINLTDKDKKYFTIINQQIPIMSDSSIKPSFKMSKGTFGCTIQNNYGIKGNTFCGQKIQNSNMCDLTKINCHLDDNLTNINGKEYPKCIGTYNNISKTSNSPVLPSLLNINSLNNCEFLDKYLSKKFKSVIIFTNVMNNGKHLNFRNRILGT